MKPIISLNFGQKSCLLARNHLQFEELNTFQQDDPIDHESLTFSNSIFFEEYPQDMAMPIIQEYTGDEPTP